MKFIKYFIVIYLICNITMLSKAQEEDFIKLKTDQYLPNGTYVRISTIFDNATTNIRVISIRESDHPLSNILKTIVYSNSQMKEFEQYVQVIYQNQNILIMDMINPQIQIYSKDWELKSEINYNDKFGVDNIYIDDVILYLTEKELVYIGYGCKFLVYDYFGNFIFEYSKLFNCKGELAILRVFEINPNESILQFTSHMEVYEIYSLNIKNKSIVKGPNMHEIGEEFQLGRPLDIYCSKKTGYIYMGFLNKWCITDMNKSFISIPVDRLRYSFMSYNPIHITGTNKILLYNHNKHMDVMRVYNVDTGAIESEINLNDFYKNHSGRIKNLIYIFEGEDNYYVGLNLIQNDLNLNSKVLYQFSLESMNKNDLMSIKDGECTEFVPKKDLQENIK